VLRQPTGLRDRQAQCIRRHRRRTRRSGVAIRPLPPPPSPRASDFNAENQRNGRVISFSKDYCGQLSPGPQDYFAAAPTTRA